MKRAFTLIELLVVIAIIAILAAILFPVFAQAKAAAKKTASLSNIKQVGLSTQMYSADADDTMVLTVNGTMASLGNVDPNPHANMWVWLTQPYIKSLQLMKDPAGIGDGGIFGQGPSAWYRNQNLFPTYGYNFLFLSPWYDCDTAESRSFTAASDPAQTVQFTQSRHPGYTNNYGYWSATAPGMIPIIYPHEHYCITTGVGWAKNPTTRKPYTGDVNTSINEGTNVNWLDGHAKFMKSDALAAGTDYGTSNNPETTRITDKTKYLWDLDGDFFGG
jgi:prepilin-type N-terminal cleavage/methylation domain-containing protein/prepilin-type processing-associated H-X9-DG protein